MEHGSSPHIHSSKQEGAQGPSIELQVCLLLHHEAGDTMMWWQKAGAECICPVTQLNLRQGLTLPPPLEISPSPWQPLFGPHPRSPRRCHRPLQDSGTKSRDPLALTDKPPRERLLPPARAPPTLPTSEGQISIPFSEKRKQGRAEE